MVIANGRFLVGCWLVSGGWLVGWEMVGGYLAGEHNLGLGKNIVYSIDWV